jgi:predicted nucleic acid-binding protein
VKAFFDANVLIYSATSDPKKQRAVACLGGGGITSVQVLNEFVHVARNKLRHDWPQIELALGLFRASLDDVVEAGCDTLYSEDMQHGRTFGGLTILNPFAP